MSMPIADDKMGTLGRPPEDPTPPADICRPGFGEDFDTLLPWHVDAVWSQTARSGGEWLFCQISSPEGSAEHFYQFNPNSFGIRRSAEVASLWPGVVVWYGNFRITCVIVLQKRRPQGGVQILRSKGRKLHRYNQSLRHRVAGTCSPVPQRQSHSPLLWTVPAQRGIVHATGGSVVFTPSLMRILLLVGLGIGFRKARNYENLLVARWRSNRARI